MGGSVVSGESVDSRFDENESELAVSVLSVSLQMLSDVDSLLDHVVKILGEGGGQPVLLEDSHDLVAGDTLDLGDTVVVSKNNTDLGWGAASPCHLQDLLN